MTGSRAWLTLAIALTALSAAASALAVRAGNPADADAAEVVILGSGAQVDGGRDPDTRLIACDGPACPAGDLPQAAFVVPRHPSYGAAIAGTSFIAPVPDGTSMGTPGYPCCTTAVFEHTFALPPEAISATISLTVLADNHAAVLVNGVEFGQQPQSYAPGNYAGPRETFATDFVPARDGRNSVRVVLWNGGGAVGVHYSGVVTWVAMVDSDGDGVPDDSDAFPHSDMRPTVHVGRCATPVHNLPLGTPRGATFNDLLARALTDGPRDDRAARVMKQAAEWRDSGFIHDRDVARIAACAGDP
jgi:hypothetical protein